MPYINTDTNIEITDEKREILKSQLGKAISIMGKSESWLMLGFSDKKPMCFKGDSSQPTAFVDVSVFGNPSDAACSEMTKKICSIYCETLGISPDRIYVKYSGTSQWGWNNMNF